MVAPTVRVDSAHHPRHRKRGGPNESGAHPFFAQRPRTRRHRSPGGVANARPLLLPRIGGRAPERRWAALRRAGLAHAPFECARSAPPARLATLALAPEGRYGSLRYSAAPCHRRPDRGGTAGRRLLRSSGAPSFFALAPEWGAAARPVPAPCRRIRGWRRGFAGTRPILGGCVAGSASSPCSPGSPAPAMHGRAGRGSRSRSNA